MHIAIEMATNNLFDSLLRLKVVSSFGADVDGGVSLPKFLQFLGKEYRRRGNSTRESGGGLAGRLRLILKKVLHHVRNAAACASFASHGTRYYPIPSWLSNVA